MSTMRLMATAAMIISGGLGFSIFLIGRALIFRPQVAG